MYIRWKVRRGAARGNWLSLSAALLECRRIDGRPRQHYVAGLGTIRVHDELLPNCDPEDWVRIGSGGFAHLRQLVWFWRHLADRLDGLDLPEQRPGIESQITSRVPRPTDAQRLAYP